MAEQQAPARRVLENVERQTEAVTKKFWFLDLKFQQFATPRLIGFVFMLYLVLVVINSVAFAGYAVWTLPLLQAVLSIAAFLIIMLISAILVRVFLETFLVVFRIAETLTELRYLKNIAEKP